MKKILPKQIPILWKTIHYKQYPRLDHVKLPKQFNAKPSTKDLLKILSARKSERSASEVTLSLEILGRILYHSAGLIYRSEDSKNLERRPYPSGGARYPIEIYPIIFQIPSITAGVYHYDILGHQLVRLVDGNYSIKIASWCSKQDWIAKMKYMLVLTAIFPRSTIKYNDRGYRFAFFEAGHIAQNVYLLATYFNLNCCAIGGFQDEEINKLLDIDGENESAIYLLALG